MIDELLSLKGATIQRGVSRAREDFARAPNTFAAEKPAQDAAILRSLRGCQATLGMDQHRIGIESEPCPAPQNIDEHVRALAWACIPAVSAPVREASKARIPTLERRSHQAVHADYATCIDGQRHRLSKKRKSSDYSQDDGCKSNPMIFKNLFTQERQCPGVI